MQRRSKFVILSVCIQILYMIIDLTSSIKSQHSKYDINPAPPSSTPSISANIKFYFKYLEDIHLSLLKINKSLTDNRQNYFSNASYSFQAFNDRQRLSLNQAINNNLSQISMKLQQLHANLKKQGSFKRKTQHEHFKAAVMCLFQFYKKVEMVYKEFEHFSLKKMKKIQETILLDKQNQKQNYKVPKIQSNGNPIQQRQQYEQQARSLYKQKIEEQDKLKQTKKQIESINEMMSNMSTIVFQQEMKTSGFLQIGQTGLFHIEKGNKNLVEANILANQTGKWYSILFLSLAFSLLVLDFLKS